MNNSIVNLKVNQFRGLQDFQLNDLGSFNILMGRNYAGKTSALEAIYLNAECPDLNLPITLQSNREISVAGFEELTYLFNNLDITKNIEMESTFAGLYPKKKIILTVENQLMEEMPETQQLLKPDKQVYSNFKTIESNSSPVALEKQLWESYALQYHAEIIKDDGSCYKYESAIRQQPSGQLYYEPMNTPSDIIVPSLFIQSGRKCYADLISDVLFKQREAELIQFLNQIKFKVTRVVTKGNEVFVDIGLDRLIPASAFGSGLCHAMNIISSCIMNNNSIILIDEIDYGLHFDILIDFLAILLNLVNRNKIQIITTTHSIDILKSVTQLLESEEGTSYRNMVKCYKIIKKKNRTSC